MGLTVAPITLREARRFVGEHHRHNLPPKGWLFGCQAIAQGERVGVVIVGRPLARALDDGYSAEVLRCCTTGYANACSFLYGRAKRAAAALGYRRVYTYTRADEDGASLKAAGFRIDAELDAREGWTTHTKPRMVVDLFGEHRHGDTIARVRWLWEA